ncbi:hypothetical protein [Sediminibacterium goheungense]|uniref:YcxB-like protein n=1 Tax=Sediminibacterium goheungense TaxID=1086393 RepID=A0A4R6J254_9BACT|nr:hypothetical protein [Sediminibacterium goheungense]TDO28967.1 hypothetical protein BC659_1049 [Sediminibacterium goheungense]
MPDAKTYTAYYKRVPLSGWFYVEVFLLFVMLIGIAYNFVMIFSGNGERRDWFSFVHIFLLISVSIRVVKRYRKSKINHCFVTVDDAGISWLLPVESYKAKEKQIIAWMDIKKVIIGEEGITIRYTSTYFTDSIPFATISTEDKQQLFSALRTQLKERVIVFEDRMIASMRVA